MSLVVIKDMDISLIMCLYLWYSLFYSIIPTNINDELFMLFVGDKTMDELISKKND